MDHSLQERRKSWGMNKIRGSREETWDIGAVPISMATSPTLSSPIMSFQTKLNLSALKYLYVITVQILNIRSYVTIDFV